MLAAMLVIGSWITARIEQSVVDNTASAAALYLGSFVSPIEPGTRRQRHAVRTRRRAPCTRASPRPAFGERIVSFKHLEARRLDRLRLRPRPDRPALHADPGTEGRLGRPGQRQLRRPRRPRERRRERRSAYRCSRSTRRSARSGRARSSRSPSSTRWRPAARTTSPTPALRAGSSSPASSSAAGCCSSASSAPAAAPSRRQERMLREQIAESRGIAGQNSELRRRAIGASARATAQAERSLRRVSADLHDGPAQYVALAAMRLDSMVSGHRGRPDRSDDHPRRAADRARRDPHDLARPVAARPGPSRLDELVVRAVDGHRRHADQRGRAATTTGRRRPGTRRLGADLPLSLPAGGAVERDAPRPRRASRGRRSAPGPTEVRRQGPRRRPRLRPRSRRPIAPRRRRGARRAPRPGREHRRRTRHHRRDPAPGRPSS